MQYGIPLTVLIIVFKCLTIPSWTSINPVHSCSCFREQTAAGWGTSGLARLLPRVLRPRNVSFSLSYQLSCFILGFDWYGFFLLTVFHTFRICYFYSKNKYTVFPAESCWQGGNAFKASSSVCSSLRQCKVIILQTLVLVNLWSLHFAKSSISQTLQSSGPNTFLMVWKHTGGTGCQHMHVHRWMNSTCACMETQTGSTHTYIHINTINTNGCCICLSAQFIFLHSLLALTEDSKR